MAAVGNYEIVTGTYGPISPTPPATLAIVEFRIPAPAGKKVLSGFLNPDNAPTFPNHNSRGYPDPSGDEWVFNPLVNDPAYGTYYVICAEMG